MGYYTYYTMTVKHVDGSDFTPEQLQKLTEAFEAKSIIGYAVGRGEIVQWKGDPQHVYFGGADAVKWYDHENDMIEISKQFPDCKFCLDGDGEDQGDVWKKYFMNGRSETCMQECWMPEPTDIPW